jgi:CRP/FNR family transcriptional regulator, cyclic AMP receptor protein
MNATIKQLCRIMIFSKLQRDSLEQMRSHTQVKKYPQGEMIFREGDTLPEKLYGLVDGKIRVLKIASTGKETVLRTLNGGEIFAAPAFLGNGIAPATVSALVDCEIVTVERGALLDAIRETPEIALTMLGVFNHRLQQLHNTVHGLVSERAIVRLTQFIQSAATEQGIQVTQQGVCLVANLSYYQIARSIGISYEECVRLFKQLQDVISYQRGKIIVLSPEKLDAIACGS